MKTSRRQTRSVLIQNLYAEIFCKNVDLRDLADLYSDEIDFHNLDMSYFSSVHTEILKNFQKLLGIILSLAPKFEIEKLPKIHILILMLALTEMLFLEEKIDEKISVNEAVELAKIFSDTAGAKFINGALGNFIKNRENFENTPAMEYNFFA